MDDGLPSFAPAWLKSGLGTTGAQPASRGTKGNQSEAGREGGANASELSHTDRLHSRISLPDQWTSKQPLSPDLSLQHDFRSHHPGPPDFDAPRDQTFRRHTSFGAGPGRTSSLDAHGGAGGRGSRTHMPAREERQYGKRDPSLVGFSPRGGEHGRWELRNGPEVVTPRQIGPRGGFEKDFPSLQPAKGRLSGRSTSDSFASWQPLSPISPAPAPDQQWTSRLADVPPSPQPRSSPALSTPEVAPAAVPSSPLPPPRMADAVQKANAAREAAAAAQQARMEQQQLRQSRQLVPMVPSAAAKGKVGASLTAPPSPAAPSLGFGSASGKAMLSPPSGWKAEGGQMGPVAGGGAAKRVMLTAKGGPGSASPASPATGGRSAGGGGGGADQGDVAHAAKAISPGTGPDRKRSDFYQSLRRKAPGTPADAGPRAPGPGSDSVGSPRSATEDAMATPPGPSLAATPPGPSLAATPPLCSPLRASTSVEPGSPAPAGSCCPTSPPLSALPNGHVDSRLCTPTMLPASSENGTPALAPPALGTQFPEALLLPLAAMAKATDEPAGLEGAQTRCVLAAESSPGPLQPGAQLALAEQQRQALPEPGIPAEEAAFLRSLGWQESDGSDEGGLTLEEIASFQAKAKAARWPSKRVSAVLQYTVSLTGMGNGYCLRVQPELGAPVAVRSHAVSTSDTKSDTESD